MYIGLLSDTHGVFDPAFKYFLAPCDQLWHAGDFGGALAEGASPPGSPPPPPDMAGPLLSDAAERIARKFSFP